MSRESSAMDRLVRRLATLPGIGKKSAQRMVYHILRQDPSYAASMAEALVEAVEKIHPCPVCQNYTEDAICAICADHRRDHSTICVVEQPKDVAAMERTGQFKGTYHVLHGTISPMEGRGPESIRIDELLARVDETIGEVIIATNPTVNGEVTGRYVAGRLEDKPVKVTRIAHGIPMGGDLDFFDETTIALAMLHRRNIDEEGEENEIFSDPRI